MPITSTAACVLGILQMGPAPGQPGFGEGMPMTGGQVFAAAERSVSRFWNLTRSQVYAALPRLQADGLVEPAGPLGPRGAQPYRITPAGRDQFRTWLASFVSDGARAEQLRSPLLLAIFFGEFTDLAQLTALVEEYRARSRRSEALAEKMLAALADDGSLPGAALVRRAAYERMQIDWLSEVLRRIAARTE